MNLQQKYLHDLEATMQKFSKFKKKVIMLSGGIDSLVMLAAARKIWPTADIQCVTLVGLDTYDSKKASATANYFNCKQHICQLTLDTVMPILISDLAGTGYLRLFMGLLDAYYECALRHGDLSLCKDADVFYGEGADGMYGSSGPFKYIRAGEVAAAEGITKDEARTRLKAQYLADKFKKRGKGAEGDVIMRAVTERCGGHAVLPYLDRRYKYVEELPFSVIDPNNKTWVKEATRIRYNLPPEMVNRKRVAFEIGTGLYYLAESELQRLYPELGKSVNKIVTHLCGNRDMRPVAVGTRLTSDVLDVVSVEKAAPKYWGGRKVFATREAMKSLNLSAGVQSVNWSQFTVIPVSKTATMEELCQKIK